MQEIRRDIYLNQVVRKMGNGLIKVITGIRRSGKSYLLDPIFERYLLSNGVPADHILRIELDRLSNRHFHHDPEQLEQYILSKIIDERTHYILLDEIQLVDQFELLLNSLLYERNLDIYITGSNSKFLSSDIITEFRGRSDRIHVNPLSFGEFYPASGKDKSDAWSEYLAYGGMPMILAQKTDEDKATYLKELFIQTYISDIVERHQIRRTDILDSMIDILASSVGSLTNAQKIYDTFKSHGIGELSINTVNDYIRYLEDAFLIQRANRYDVKGRKYISTPQKYFFSDVGLRNARLNFRQQEPAHLMENIIYNELRTRGYNVDVGVVTIRDNDRRIQTEVDFICNTGSNRYYIQSALNIDTPEKLQQEVRPLCHIGDSFKKIIVVKDNPRPWRNNDGILVMGILDFLLDLNSLNL